MQPSRPTAAETLEARRRWMHHASTATDADCPVRVGLAGSFTVEPLVPFLGSALLEAGLGARIAVAPYNQLFQTCLAPRSTFGGDCDVVVLLWRIEDLMGENLSSCVSGRVGAAIDEALEKLDELLSAVRALRENHDGTIVVSTPPFPRTVTADVSDLHAAQTVARMHRRLCEAWCDGVADIPDVIVADLDGLQRQFGAEAAFDPRKWYLYRQPYAEPFVLQMGRLLARVIRSRRGPLAKCIVLDCDNTLWGGIVGEDGLEGIQLSDEFPGRAYRDFQQYLLHCRERGLILAVLSKNNEADVWRVFDGHDGMLLKREHLAAWRIDWAPKAVNVAALADELSLGTDSFVFIDDSPFEVEQMRSVRPEVHSVLLPEDPAFLMRTVRNLGLLDRPVATREDRRRGEMYTRERERRSLKQTLSPEQFLRSLELKVEVFLPQEEHLGRVAQLINKTNQFNLTTLRRGLEEVRQVCRSPRHRVYAARVRDRFGDYGLTGAAIVEIDGETWSLDTFLLSCRVLGRQVETAVLAHVIDEARRAGAALLTGRFLPTPKNAPAASFFSDHGFERAGPDAWQADLASFRLPPLCVEVSR